MRSLLCGAVEWSAKAPPSAKAARARQAAVDESRVRALCDPDSSDEGVGRISRNLLKWILHLFEFVRDAQIPRHNIAGERAIRSIYAKRKPSGGDAERRWGSDVRLSEQRARDDEAKGRGVAAGRDGSRCPSPDPSPHEKRLNRVNRYDERT